MEYASHAMRKGRTLQEPLFYDTQLNECPCYNRTFKNCLFNTLFSTIMPDKYDSYAALIPSQTFVYCVLFTAERINPSTEKGGGHILAIFGPIAKQDATQWML